MKLRYRIKWLDPLTQAMFIFLAGASIGSISILKKNEYFMVLALAIMAYSMLMALKAGKGTEGMLLENDYEGPVNFKSEAGCMPVSLPPGSGYPIPVDGINTGVKPGKVFKVRSGSNVYITKTGQIKCYSPISALVNGWKPESF